MPPGFSKSITEPAIDFDMNDVHNAIGHLKKIVLSDPGTSWNTTMWIAAVVKLDSDIPLIHIPVFSLRRRIFQDESPITVGHDFFMALESRTSVQFCIVAFMLHLAPIIKLEHGSTKV
jgi:hypothetical protein